MPDLLRAQHAFRGVLLRSILIPLVLTVLLAGVFAWQVGRLIRIQDYVESIDRTISRLNRLEKLHIDLETGLRGYLISGSAQFLDPYTRANAELPTLYATLVEAFENEPDASSLLARVRERRGRWQAYAEDQIKRRDAGDPSWQSVAIGGQGKREMDAMREQFGTLITLEESERDERTQGAQRSVRAVLLTACGFALLAGLGIAFASRGQLHWLGETYERALRSSRELSATLERRVADRTAELSTSNERLGDANKELEAFAYSVSHDLRAPMRHITGFAQLLRASAQPRLTEEDTENLNIIYQTAIFAGRMVDDLLAFSRVGRTKMRQVPVDMNVLVRQSRDELSPELAGRNVEWSVADLPPATGDPALLKLVWQNLLANAVKYTAKLPDAHVEIGSRIDGAGGTTYFVRDDGVGFDMAYAHKLFGVFQRLHRSEDFEGTGIGLANVRRIILRHGGTVAAEGRLDGGATFSFTLPAATTAETLETETVNG